MVGFDKEIEGWERGVKGGRECRESEGVKCRSSSGEEDGLKGAKTMKRGSSAVDVEG